MARKTGNGSVADLTVAILKEIREEIRSTNRGLEVLREDVNARLDQHEQALVKLIGEVRMLNTQFADFLTGDYESTRFYSSPASFAQRKPML